MISPMYINIGSFLNFTKKNFLSKKFCKLLNSQSSILFLHKKSNPLVRLFFQLLIRSVDLISAKNKIDTGEKK